MAEMSSIGTYFRDGVDGALHYVPFFSPAAVDEDRFSVNINLVIVRAVSIVALPLIALLGLQRVFPPISRLGNPRIVCFCLNIFSFVAFVFERWKAGVQLDRLAAEKYMALEAHSAQVSRHLCSNDRALRYLMTKTKDNKSDSEGKTLIDRMFSPETWYSTTRKIVIDEAQDLISPAPDGKSLLMRVVESRDEALLEYLFGPKGKVSVASLTDKQQGDIWTQVKTVRMFKLLCKYGFNINVRNSSGLTPLMHWAKSRKVHGCFEDDSVSKLVCAALNKGADPSVEYEGQKASTLAKKNSFEEKFLLQGEREFHRPKVPLLQEEGFFGKLPWRSLIINEKNWRDPDATRKGFGAIMQISGAIISWIHLCEQQKWVPMSESTMKVVRNAIKVFCLIPLVLGPVELWRSWYEARRHTVNNYLAKIVPSKHAIDIIQRDVEAVQLLLSRAPKEAHYLEKLDKDRRSLLQSNDKKVRDLLKVGQIVNEVRFN